MSGVSTISTPRLLLEPWREGVRAQWVALYSDTRVTESLGTGRPLSHKQIEAEFDWMVEHWAEHGFGWYSVLDKKSGDWIGAVGLSYLEQNPAGLPPEDIEIGWWLKPESWGGGLATEAASATIDDGFARKLTDLVWARHNARNPSSGRIMEKLGMRFVRDGTGIEGVPIRIYELRREHWLELKQ